VASHYAARITGAALARADKLSPSEGKVLPIYSAGVHPRPTASAVDLGVLHWPSYDFVA
jgi:hypothetical protein